MVEPHTKPAAPEGAALVEATTGATRAELPSNAATAAAVAAPAAASPHETLDYWGYQTCTEFGFYQTCEVGSGCFFTQGLDTLASSDSFCEQWGISPSDIQRAIDDTNSFYGGGRPDLPPHNASRILYVNGDVDPWHGLSILKAPSAELPTLMVSGASHHAWTHPSASTDQPTVVAARLAIRKQLSAWL